MKLTIDIDFSNSRAANDERLQLKLVGELTETMGGIIRRRELGMAVSGVIKQINTTPVVGEWRLEQ